MISSQDDKCVTAQRRTMTHGFQDAAEERIVRPTASMYCLPMKP
jgi:hypothetical protein